MSKTKRKIDHLYQRPGSQNWYIKLQSPGARVEKSLGTSDHRQAVVLALPLIAEHKARLLAARLRFETTWRHEYEPGREHAGPDGQRILATDKELFFIGHNGSITRTTLNGGLAHQLVGGPLTLRSLAEAVIKADFGDGAGERPTVAVKNGDDAILETYLQHASVTGHFEREARDVWALFRSLCDKPLKDCDRDDGRKLVAHFEGQGLKSATIRKKLTWPCAACNLAIREGKLRFNPFSSIIPKRDDAQRRLPFNEADIAEAKRNLDRLSESDRLLFRLLATTGMRLGEAFQIDTEAKERGCRFVIVGTKTDQSRRRVPLPNAVLPFLPKAIRGPLFAGSPAAASKRLNRFLREIGIVDPAKVIHSTRHRAQDRLRAAGCPQDVREELLGHEKKSVAAGYGVGHPVPLLKRWIDEIGF
jgi:integrase